ncbi:MAG: DUF4349 domain-containing protein [Acidobacteriota bacterium]|nr:DUF4349 domain-containing protein [Acidobacteriota bacterium]
MKKFIAVALVVLASACRAESDSAMTSVESAGSTAAPQLQRVAVKQAAAMPRMIVRKADMHIVVGDTNVAVERATRAVESVGGYVAGSNVWREGELLRAELTLRVPADKLTSTIAAIRGLAKRVNTETVTSDDVSQEFVDLDARVRNLEATEAELRQLLTTARQNGGKASEVLEVHQRLTEIRGEIEQAKGRMRYLSQVTAMSSIALNITPDALAQPVVQPGWQPVAVAKNAARALVSMLQTLANVAIWLAIYVAPLVGVFALVLLMGWKVWRRLRVAA